MKNITDTIRILPSKIAQIIEDKISRNNIEEIRMKIGKPIILNSYKGEEIVDYIITNEDLKYIISKISNYSLYAFEEQIKQGYITMKGGNRIGLAGQCVMENGEIKTIRNISSINIRLCKEVIGAAKKVMPYIVSRNRVYNTLIISPPKCGKTTMLRDITKNLSNGMESLSLNGKNVTVIDERSEIGACVNGIPQMNVGIRTDILDNCYKKNGMIMAIRSLAPEVIVCDEIGTFGELEALQMAFNSGVNIVVTVHGYDIEDVANRKVFKELLEEMIIQRVIVLSAKYGPGTVEKIYRVKMGGNLECLSMVQ